MKTKLKTIACILLSSVILCLSGCSFFDNSNDSTSKPDPPEPKPIIQTFNHNFNDIVKFNGLEYKFINYSLDAMFYYNYNNKKTYFPSTSSATYFIITLNLHNPTNETINLYDNILTERFNYKLVYNNDAKYLSLADNAIPFLRNYVQVQPLSTLSSVILLFEIPKSIAIDSSKFELEISENKTNPTEYHYISIQN